MSPPAWTSLPPPSPPHPLGCNQAPDLSSLSHTANAHGLSISHMVVCFHVTLSISPTMNMLLCLMLSFRPSSLCLFILNPLFLSAPHAGWSQLTCSDRIKRVNLDFGPQFLAQNFKNPWTFLSDRRVCTTRWHTEGPIDSYSTRARHHKNQPHMDRAGNFSPTSLTTLREVRDHARLCGSWCNQS